MSADDTGTRPHRPTTAERDDAALELARIRDRIDDLDKRIVELLKDQNIEIARRTVAKYREQLRILSSSKRRQVF